MRAVVLVGGEGTRLRPLTYTTPKQMLPVAGCTMIERVLGQLARHGVTDAVLSLCYRPDVFMDAFPDGRAAGVSVTYAVEPELLDTAGAIRFAAASAGVGETFLVVNGDVLTDLDVGALVRTHEAARAEATIALTPVEDPSRYGVVVTGAGGRVSAFVEKPPPGTAPSKEINAGTYVLEPSVLQRIPEGRRVSVERETFPALVADGSLCAMSSNAYWLDTGTPDAFVQAQLDLLGGRWGPGAVPGGRESAPGLWRRGDPSVSEAASLAAPLLLDEGAHVDADARVESSVVGPGCSVGEGAGLTRSMLLAGARLGEGASVTSSIVGFGAVIGAGASLRHCVVADGATVKVGATLVDEKVEA